MTLWTVAHQVSLSFTLSLSLLKLMFLESVILSNHLILCTPFSSCLQSFPASGSFPVSWLFASGSQSIGASASASVFSMNIQSSFFWIDSLISLLCNRAIVYVRVMYSLYWVWNHVKVFDLIGILPSGA